MSPIYPTHNHFFTPTSESTEQCTMCGYLRYRGIVGFEVFSGGGAGYGKADYMEETS